MRRTPIREFLRRTPIGEFFWRQHMLIRGIRRMIGDIPEGTFLWAKASLGVLVRGLGWAFLAGLSNLRHEAPPLLYRVIRVLVKRWL